jgi:CHAT domain-containing protein
LVDGDDQSPAVIERDRPQPPLLAQVSEAVWKPVAAKLPAGVTRLVIVPAAYLNYLPFQVLPMEDGRAVIERYAVSYLPSASTMMLLGEAPRMTLTKANDLFLGALGNVSVDGWAPLPGTLRETDGIAQIFPEAARASGNLLTHERAVKALQENREVHLATHGLLDEHAPLFSALLLSPAPGQPAPGRTRRGRSSRPRLLRRSSRLAHLPDLPAAQLIS